MGRLFGTDGVRGIANRELTAKFAMDLGIATAKVLTKKKDNITVIIGRDTRISGDMLVSSLIAGFTSIGVNVIDLGIIPTPAISYLVSKYGAMAGIMVTASHNPSYYNGIKIFDKKGFKLPDDLENEIEEVMLNIDDHVSYTKKMGRVIRCDDGVNDYIDHVISSCNVNLEGLNIVVDCANGASSVTADKLFNKLGCNYKIINKDYDGFNINDGCGSTNMDVIINEVINNDYDCGIAYDGDADRCIMVDKNGIVMDGDYLMAIAVDYYKKNKKLVNNTVVGTVMSNLGFIKFCESNDIDFIPTKVGDRYVLEEMLLNNYILGGEQSGHIIFKEYSNTGDGELTSVKILEIMKRSGKSLEELANVMKKYPQVLLNVKVDNDKKNDFYYDDNISDEIERISKLLGNDGRVLVRPSGTEPLIRVMIEGSDENMIERYAKEIANVIEKKLN